MVLLSMLALFVLLVFGHFALDYQFQSGEVALGKNPKNSPHLTVPWPYWLASHVSVHALGVYLLTGNLGVACAEWAAHFVIDWAKCKGYYGIHEDQALHVVCKFLWVVILGVCGALPCWTRW